MVGVADGKPWFHVDGERGAWFFSSQAVREARAAGFFLITAHKNSMSGVPGAADQTPPSESPAQPTSLGSTPNEPDMSFRDFLGLSDCPKWTAAMDSVIIRAVNDYCDLRKVCPWSLTCKGLLDVIASHRLELETLAHEADSHAGARWWGDDGALSDDAILARYGVLRLFNDRLVHSFPFIGIGDGLSLASAHVPAVSIWGMPNIDRGLGVGDHVSQCLSSSYLFSRGAGRGLGPLLCILRGSVFLSTKVKLLRAAIDRTTTPTMKAEDDYDYPEDLPQVSTIFTCSKCRNVWMVLNFTFVLSIGANKPSQVSEGAFTPRPGSPASTFSLWTAL